MNAATTVLLLVAVILELICPVTSRLLDKEQEQEVAQIVDNKFEHLRSAYAARGMPKRAHSIESRSLNQFKNCYFSPIQCVLVDKKRK